MDWICSDSNENLPIIGNTTSHISDEKLPSQKQLLQLLYHFTRIEHMNLKVSTKKVIDRVRVIWELAEIPIIRKDKCIKKLEDLEKEYDGLKKNRHRSNNQLKEHQFSCKIESLFDIAHGTASKAMDEHKTIFRHDQRSTRNYPISHIQSIKLGLRSGTPKLHLLISIS